MSESIEKKQTVALDSADYSRDQIDLIKQTVAKGATDLELRLFLYQAKKTGLDPLTRQIHCVKRWNTKANKEEMSIQTGIDGYRVIADRTGQYAGNDDYEFDDPEQQPKWAKSTVYKMVGGQRCAFSATARWSQYFPGDKQGFMWRKMPHVMLGKCAEALALRKAFPADLSGVYTKEEMEQAGEEIGGQKTEATQVRPLLRSPVMDLSKVKPVEAKPAQTYEPGYHDSPFPDDPVETSLSENQRPKQKISESQHNDLIALIREAGLRRGEVRELLSAYEFKATSDITRDCYDEFIRRVRMNAMNQ